MGRLKAAMTFFDKDFRGRAALRCRRRDRV